MAAASFRKPYCSGKTCGAIGVEELGGGKYTFERHPYGDDEKAVFSLSGPGEVRITLFGTEKGYDSLKVGGSSVTGIPHDLPKVSRELMGVPRKRGHKLQLVRSWFTLNPLQVQALMLTDVQAALPWDPPPGSP